MEVKIEAPLCIGSGSCEMMAPDLFRVGTDGVAEVVVDTVEPQHEAAANSAAASCPTQAIIVSP